MKRTIIFLSLLATICGGVQAQPKVGAKVPIREKRGYDQRIVIDTAQVRVLYELNATDIKNEGTYIDLGKLEVGKHVTKYSSEFIHLSIKRPSSGRRKKVIRDVCPRVSGFADAIMRTGANWSTGSCRTSGGGQNRKGGLLMHPSVANYDDTGQIFMTCCSITTN